MESKEKSTNVRTKIKPSLERFESMTVRQTVRRLQATAALTATRTALGAAAFASTELASRIAFHLFMRPRRFARPARERRLLAWGDRFVVRVGKCDVSAWSWGHPDGPLVVLAHGWESRGSHFAVYVNELCEAGYRVVAFDAPGHGSSRAEHTSLLKFADAIDAVIARVTAGTRKVHALLAHSMGGAASLLWLHEHPEASVERLVILSGPGTSESFTRVFAEQLKLSEEVVASMLREVEERYRFSAKNHDPRILAKGIRVPTLLVHDADDAIVPVTEAYALGNALPNARVQETKGLGHERILRDETTVKTVLSFLKPKNEPVPYTRVDGCLDRELFQRDER
jgi:pimeloyl-ACP methyl ester carboxylesterase